MRILLFSSYGMLAFLASKRLLLSGELLFGVSHHGLLRALHFRLPRSVLCLGGRELRAACLGPFPCGLGAVCAFVRFPIAVFQYAASGLLVLDKCF